MTMADHRERLARCADCQRWAEAFLCHNCNKLLCSNCRSKHLLKLLNARLEFLLYNTFQDFRTMCRLLYILSYEIGEQYVICGVICICVIIFLHLVFVKPYVVLVYICIYLFSIFLHKELNVQC